MQSLFPPVMHSLLPRTNQLQCLLRVSQVTISCLSFLAIALAVALISAVIFVVCFVITPMVFPTFSLGALIHYLLVAWIAPNIVFNYIMSLSVAPGSPVEGLMKEQSGHGEDDTDVTVGGWSRYCKVCCKAKPPRAHHCHMCGVCILKMDHHCPWINSCVGHHNQRYFLLFLFYLWVGTLYVSTVLFLCNIGLIGSVRGIFATPSLMFTFVLCVAIFVAMSVFVGWNAHLCLTNQTTVEWHGNRMKAKEAKANGEIYWNEYNLGRRRNLQQIFGPFRQWWQILIPSFGQLDSNGHAFPTMMEMRSTV